MYPEFRGGIHICVTMGEVKRFDYIGRCPDLFRDVKQMGFHCRAYGFSDRAPC